MALPERDVIEFAAPARDIARLSDENPNPVLRVANDGTIAYANPAARALGKLLWGDDRRIVQKIAIAIAGARRSGESRQVELEKDGRFYTFTIVPADGETYVGLYGREITQERQALLQVRDLARFPEESPHPVMRVGSDGALLYANTPAKVLPGLLTDGTKLPADVLAAVPLSFAGQEIRTVDFTSGERQFVFAVTPAVGMPYVNIFGRDVTRERRAQQQMRELSKFPEENSSPVLRINADGEVLYANAAARQVSGLLRQEGRHAGTVLDQPIADVMASGKPADLDFAAGDAQLVFTLMPVTEAGYVNIYGRDATQERNSRAELDARAQAARDLLDALPEGVLLLDADAIVKQANATAHTLLGFEPGRLLGRPLAELLAGESQWLVSAVSESKGSAEQWQERELATKTNVRKPFNLWLRVLPESKDAPSTERARLLVIQDIPEEKQGEDEQRKADLARNLPDSIVERVLSENRSLQFGGERTATVLLGKFHKPIQPGDIVGQMSSLTEIIFSRSGMLERCGGDDLLAAFGIPFESEDDDDSDRAVAAAIEILRRHAQADLTIALYRGKLIAGEVSLATRRDYVFYGASTTAVSVIAAAGRYYGTPLLLDVATMNALKRKPALREIDTVRLPDVGEPVSLYEVLDHYDSEAFPHRERVTEAYAEGLKHYRARRWQEATQALNRAIELHPGDRPTQLLQARCWARLTNPPGEDWSAVGTLALR